MDYPAVISTLIVLAVAAPLTAGLIGVFGKNSTRVNTVVQTVNILGAAAGLFGAAIFLLLQGRGLFVVGRPAILDLAGLLPFLPAGALVIDSLSGYFLLLVNLGALLVGWYSVAYLPRYAATYRFPWLHAAGGLFVAGMLLTVLAGTPLGFLLAWELMSFAAYYLVIADRAAASIKAGLSYIVMTQLGAACLIAGFAIFSQGNLGANLAALGVGLSPSLALVGFFLLFAGFAGKAGIFPLHEWLPAAHPQAPSNASALMSGVMLKVALYGLLRTLGNLMHFDLPVWAALVVIALGLFSGFYGALKAVTETDVKKALAWSSVENLGLLFAMAGTVGLLMTLGAVVPAAIVWIALLIHALNHTLFKSGLFMAAGAIVSETHTRDTDLMGGLANTWPGFSKWFLLLALAAMALPPLGTFYGEWLFLQTLAGGIASSGILTGLILVAIISSFALTAGLAAFAFFKMFAGIFLAKSRSDATAHVKKLPLGLTAPVAAAALLSLALGLLMPFFMRAVWPEGNGAVFSGQAVLSGSASLKPMAIVLLLLVAIALVWLMRRFLTKTNTVVTDTWDCGAPLTSRMEYTPYGFSAPVRFFFRALAMPWKKITSEPVAPGNPWIIRQSIEHGERLIANRYLYRPVERAIGWLAGKIKRLQSGVVQFYIALIFIALIITLIVKL